MTLEDEIGDIVAKALLGKGLSRDALAAKVNRPQRELDQMIDLHSLPDEPDSLDSWARELDIDPHRLAKLSSYPESPETEFAVHQIITPFGHLGANSWWLPDVGPGILIDAGTQGTAIIRRLQDLEARPKELWITHGHHDHISGIDGLRQHYPGLIVRGPRAIHPDDTLVPGNQVHGVKVIDLDGHWEGALGFITDQFAAVGDAYFKGSIGKIPSDKWRTGLNLLRKVIWELPEDTIILPGHGPYSTAGIEKNHNPMLSPTA